MPTKSLKILLINPPYNFSIQSCQPKILEEGLDFLPPLGLMSIASYIEKYTPHHVEILDTQVEQLSYEQIKSEIIKRKPDVVGVTAMTFTILDVIELAKIVKQINPEVKIIVGGPHVVIYPEETMAIPEIDYLIIGEGEKVIKELLDNLLDTSELKKIKGLAFREEDKVIITGRADFIENLDDLPFPARHLTLYKKYFSVISSKMPVTTMFTSRGCPYKCIFCDRPQVGKNFRARSANNVVDEMEECEKMGIEEIFIYDDTFAVDRQRVLDICSEIKKRDLTIAWDIRTRVNTVDEELLKTIKNAGCQRIHYGVEAGTQKILDVLRKGITLEQVEKAFRLTKKIGIQSAAYFMIGSPTETRKDILQTIRFMKKLNPDYVHVTITTPFPATDLYRMAMEEGVVVGDPWKEFAKNPDRNFIPPIWEKELPREELFALLKKAYRSFYLRPKFVLKKIIQLKSGRELFNKTRAALKLLKI
jgi:radical SAM superfamily enzyme YgiQ (UPF0313 family)